MRKTTIILALLLTFVISACSAAQAAPRAQVEETESPLPRTITVIGTGRVTVTPDIARISMGVQTEGEDAAETVSENNTQAKAIIDALKDFGIVEDDIRTTNFSVFPRQERDREGNLLGIVYVVQNTVNVTVRDLDQVGEVLDTVVQAGANNINGIAFDVADRTEANTQALEAAVEDAGSQAEILAGAAGVTVGPVRTINSLTSAPIVPVQRMMADFAVGGGEVPIEAGQLEISTSVTIVYDIEG